MTKTDLSTAITDKGSFLCVGLDTDIRKIPAHLLDDKDPVFAFNKAIIDATLPYAVAYKPNIAFYEAMGPRGWESLERTMEYIPDHVFTIADAKRGDIGNTSSKYASCFFEYFDFDAVTVAPYMGVDSVAPFLEWEDKWVILLGLTSNAGSQDFQILKSDDRYLYEHVMTKAQEWGSSDQLMFVVGATHPKKFAEIREIAPEHFLLVPGIGAQGGDLDAVVKYGANVDGGLLINSSRGIIYAGEGTTFAETAGQKAADLAHQMQPYL